MLNVLAWSMFQHSESFATCTSLIELLVYVPQKHKKARTYILVKKKFKINK